MNQATLSLVRFILFKNYGLWFHLQGWRKIVLRLKIFVLQFFENTFEICEKVWNSSICTKINRNIQKMFKVVCQSHIFRNLSSSSVFSVDFIESKKFNFSLCDFLSQNLIYTNKKQMKYLQCFKVKFWGNHGKFRFRYGKLSCFGYLWTPFEFFP